MTGPPKGLQGLKVYTPTPKFLMVIPLSAYIVKMKAKKPRSKASEVRNRIDQTHLLLNVGMSAVMPIAHWSIWRQVRQQGLEAIIKGELLETLPILKCEFDPLFMGVL